MPFQLSVSQLMEEQESAFWTSDRPQPRERELWARIAAHDFTLGQPLGFVRRLSRDKHWTLPFTEGAIREYRRFCFLAMASPAPVTPSEEVDEVWHMHLTYTRDYWDVWCGQVLGRKLHHDPTRGSQADQATFRAQYAATLKLYEQYFGAPPEEYWPATHHRFRGMPRFRTYDAEASIRVPRPVAVLRRLMNRRNNGGMTS